MKKIFYIFLIFILACACESEFLQLENKDGMSEEYLKGGNTNAITLVNAAYSSLQKQGLYTRTASQLPQLRSDEARITKNTQKMEEDGVAAGTYTNNASGRLGEFIWRDSYNGVFRSNVAITHITDNNNVSTDLKNRLLGEVYFLRALYYFHLTLYFGDFIPRQLTPGEPEAAPFETDTEVWELMIADLKKSIDFFTLANFTNTTWSADDKGRANLGAATGMLGKVYLYYAQMKKNNDLQYIGLAKAEFDKIINGQVGTYSLLQNYMENFKNTNEYNSESLFEIGFADFGSKTWEIDQDNSGAVETNRIAKNSTMVDPIGEMWWNEAPTTRIYNQYERDINGEIIDYRCYYTLWIPGGAYFKDATKQGDESIITNVLAYEDIPWPGKDNTPSSTLWGAEYSDYRFYGWRKYGFDYNYWLLDGIAPDHVGSDINYRYMRYADVLLMYAECLHYLGSDPRPYINLVRERANNQVVDVNQSTWGNNNLPYLHDRGQLPLVENSPYASNLDAAIQHERMVELACEANRYFDIIRWHTSGKLLDLRKPGFPLANINEIIIDRGFKGVFLLPIPQRELNTNTKLKPNAAN